MNILMIGVQGSGKGTQAKLLSKKLKIPHVSSGDIFRSLDPTTEVGSKIKDLIDKGIFVPDDLTVKLVSKRLKKDDTKKGVILDGFPRNLNQARLLDEFLKLDKVVLLEISDKEAINRLTGRRTCSNKTCQTIYNIYTAPKPKVDNICDKCGSKLEQREDETEEAVKKRIATYHKETEPLTKYYKDKGILIKINGEQSIEKVQDDIEGQVDK
ncbi:adenylate kinase [Candidatus Dojkabacteria bacterium]|nr:adenylate kinase [Candidatus Dojkabacteria bacterium]